MEEAAYYALAVPLEGVAETLWKLKRRGHEIYFITARPGMKHIVQVTKDWLKKHGFPYDPSRLRMGAQDKAKIARELGIQLFFEDAPKHLDRLVEEGIPTVIVDAVYNRDYPACRGSKAGMRCRPSWRRNGEALETCFEPPSFDGGSSHSRGSSSNRSSSSLCSVSSANISSSFTFRPISPARSACSIRIV